VTNTKEYSLPQQLFWLEDVPLFADALHIDRFYDAVASPESKQRSVGLQFSAETIEKLTGKLALEASVTTEKLASLLAPLFAFSAPCGHIPLCGFLRTVSTITVSHHGWDSGFNAPHLVARMSPAAASSVRPSRLRGIFFSPNLVRPRMR
jgi:hypothetical protein